MESWNRVVGFILLFIGIAFYLSWSILYNAWTDIGLYSFTVVLVVFGVLGILASRIPENQ